MTSAFAPESDLAPFTPWGIALGESLSTFFQWCELAEDGTTVVPYPIPDGRRIDLSITWEGGSLARSTEPGQGITVQDQADTAWTGMFLVEVATAELAQLPLDRPVLFRIRSAYGETPMTIVRGEIYLDREAA